MSLKPWDMMGMAQNEVGWSWYIVVEYTGTRRDDTETTKDLVLRWDWDRLEQLGMVPGWYWDSPVYVLRSCTS